MKTTLYSACLFSLLTVYVSAQEFPRVNAVVKAVRKSGDSVVNISTERIAKRVDPFHEFRRHFFQSPFDDFFDRYQPRTYTEKNLGSGVIIDSGGYILTNEHVIHGATKIVVSLAGDKENYEAELVSSVPEKDLALLRIEPKKKLKAIEMGDSDTLMIGETAIALGNPFGFESTVTIGVVSATNRSIYSEGNVIFSGLIQTDAAINPGNSGGALLDINGRLIGINTAIKPDSEGIGFAIQVNEVKKVLKRLISVEKIKDLWLGLEVKNAGVQGVAVVTVQKKSPSAGAGIRAGSIISKVNGVRITNCFDFHKKLISSADKSTDIVLTVNGKDTKIVLEKYGENIIAARCGFKCRTLTRWMARRLRISITTPGVLLTEVYNNSPASDIGLEVGDVVVSLHDTQISTVEDVLDVLDRVGEKQEISIIVVRRNRAYPLMGKIEVK